MAPKKKQPPPPQPKKAASEAKAKLEAKSAPKLTISAENERRLRRLLLNTERPLADPPLATAASSSDTAPSRVQMAKRLRGVYDKLSLEGFSPDQIEQALSALKESTTFESALDWLCFNIPGNELPIKFSSGASLSTHGEMEGSVEIVSTTREDWVPQLRLTEEFEESGSAVSLRFKDHRDELCLDLGNSSNKEWIKQYIEQEDEEDETKSQAAAIIEEYHHAMLGEAAAKKKGEKKNQKKFTKTLHKLKQDLSMLGISDEILMSELQNNYSPETFEDVSSKPRDHKCSLAEASESEPVNTNMGEEFSVEDINSSQPAAIIEEYHHAMFGEAAAKKKGGKKNQKKLNKTLHKLKQDLSMLGISDEILMSELQNKYSPETFDDVSSKPLDHKCSLAELSESKPVNTNMGEEFSVEDIDSTAHPLKTCTEENDDGIDEMELDNLFAEDSSSDVIMPAEVLSQQRSSSDSQYAYRHNVGNFDEIWKKGEPGRLPKALLQKLCQRLGWDAPKYSKLLDKEVKLQYAVSILRLSSGRGKSRKAGGLITIQLPSNDESLKSVEDAQNKVASFALYQLFSDLPLCQMLMEPYSSFIAMWQKDEYSIKVEDNENIRRSDFVESLLISNTSLAMPSVDAQKAIIGKTITGLQFSETTCNAAEETKFSPSTYSEITNSEAAENISLKGELDNKMKQPTYRKMLKDRSALPIYKLKKNILQLLVEHDVIVVCGETGCGKTTQVPQFILDDMILSGRGGYCNIICTQPRRLAAISVAERVSQERCESSPGSDDSLVGYQVRLDSARNHKTRLLFCTTGILLRRIAGNNDLDGFSHVIVDEVHERSILGDFLIIFLKNLIEKQANCGNQNLKIILMSATADSSLFSRYFGNCPVISAEGRTYPVSTCFLEDVYEQLDYTLALDSPASGSSMPSSRKHKPGSVDDRRGKRNLVLSSWGDESLLSEGYFNPYYTPDIYADYSERTRQNLKCLNEDVIDFDLLEDTIRFIDENYPPGAILVFLPGVAEIDLLVDKLTASFQFGRTSTDWILPLHSSLSPAEQRKVFSSPPESVRKVIVATDIAETSITIDDVTYVIDSGKHKERHYNAQKKMSSMAEDWIAQANAKQRRGRAGRVKPGICFCLYTRHRFENLMRSFQVPEMLRMPLTELCLQIKSLSLGDIRFFLLKAIEPPREDAIASAIDLLYKVGAFQGNEELSPLGYHLAKLPVDVLIGKMMLYGAIFGCLSPILSVAAFLSYKFPFLNPKDEKQTLERVKLVLLNGSLQKETVSDEGIKQSDHLLLVIAYNKWARILHEDGSKAAQQFCRSSLLNSSVMYMIRDMRVQFGSLLADIGVLDFSRMTMSDGKRRDKLENWLSDMSQPFNRFANHPSVIKSILCAGLYPNVAATTEGVTGSTLPAIKAQSSTSSLKDQNFWYDGKREVYIHPSSLNHNVKQFQYPFLVFLEKVETSKVYLRDTSVISPYSILLFGGSMVIQHQVGLVIIDGWLKLNAPAQTAVLFKELRTTLHAVLKELISKPEVSKFVDNEVVKSIVQLLLEEEKVKYQKNEASTFSSNEVA